VDHEDDAGDDQAEDESAVDELLAAKEDGFAAEFAGQFTERVDGAGEGDATDENGEEDDRRSEGLITAIKEFEVVSPTEGLNFAILGPPDEEGGEATAAVKESDHLGHRRHFYKSSASESDGTADDEPGDDPSVVDDLAVE